MLATLYGTEEAWIVTHLTSPGLARITSATLRDLDHGEQRARPLGHVARLTALPHTLNVHVKTQPERTTGALRKLFSPKKRILILLAGLGLFAGGLIGCIYYNSKDIQVYRGTVVDVITVTDSDGDDTHKAIIGYLRSDGTEGRTRSMSTCSPSCWNTHDPILRCIGLDVLHGLRIVFANVRGRAAREHLQQEEQDSRAPELACCEGHASSPCLSHLARTSIHLNIGDLGPLFRQRPYHRALL